MAAKLELPRFQIRRALREPRRLARLHYSSVLTSLHSAFEPNEGEFLADCFGIDAKKFGQLETQLLDDTHFRRTLESRHREIRGASLRLLGTVSAEDHDRCYRILYYCARLQQPDVVVETGVFDGISSAFLLKALRDNEHGHLHSIDLPARTATRASTDKMLFDVLPAGAEPGWIVPKELRSRWRLHFGPSRRLLPPLLARLGTIDLFFHDSLHTYANMSWEYATAWSALAGGGLLLSDDVFWNPAFWHFTRQVGVRGRVLKGMGIARKPRPQREERGNGI
jgi:predicted O-methyltransferase YrrM